MYEQVYLYFVAAVMYCIISKDTKGTMCDCMYICTNTHTFFHASKQLNSNNIKKYIKI